MTIKHIPFDLDGGYEQWQVVDNAGDVVRTYQSADRADAALAAIEAGQPLPAPVFPEPGHGLRTCRLCGLPVHGRSCTECV